MIPKQILIMHEQLHTSVAIIFFYTEDVITVGTQQENSLSKILPRSICLSHMQCVRH